MRAVDTNVLVRLLVRDDAKQTAAAEAFVNAGAWVSTIVLSELTWVLSTVYERTPSQIASALDQLLEHETIALQDEDAVLAAVGRLRAKPTLGFSDCLILEVARKAGHLPLGTFDKDLARIGGAERLKG